MICAALSQAGHWLRAHSSLGLTSLPENGASSPSVLPVETCLFRHLLSGDRQAAGSGWVLCSFLSRASLSRYKKLEDLLEKSFSLVKMPSLQPVVMCVMKHLPKVRVVAWCPGYLCPGSHLVQVSGWLWGGFLSWLPKQGQLGGTLSLGFS